MEGAIKSSFKKWTRIKQQLHNLESKTNDSCGFCNLRHKLALATNDDLEWNCAESELEEIKHMCPVYKECAESIIKIGSAFDEINQRIDMNLLHLKGLKPLEISKKYNGKVKE